MEMMKAVQVAAKGEPMRLVEIPVPQPKEGQVLLQVEACGICHGDSKVIEVAAISRGAEKEKLVRELGAHHYIDSNKENPAEALRALGGAKVILTTASNAKVISSLYRRPWNKR